LVLPFVSVVHDVRAEGESRRILIEAEDYQRKVPEDEAFARPTREIAASKRKVLVSFFSGEYVVYGFEVPEEGKYSGWLRYAANRGVGINVAVDPKEEPTFKRAALPATGGLIGPGVWKWAKLFTADLAAGNHTLAIGRAGIRPDCIFISASDNPPTDEVIRSDPLAEYDAATRTLLAKPVVPIRPDWLDGAADYRLPSWYDQCRVQAHTRLAAAHMTRDIFLNAATGFREMGVDVFVRHIQAHTQGAWWPSKVSPVHPLAENRNLAKEIIDNAHEAGCRVIVYHVHMYDRLLGEAHPDWVCRDWRGEPLCHGKMPFMCYNSPYPDLYKQRALELVDMGVDGFYFDFVHMPKTGCWCNHCRAAFNQATGLDHPRKCDPDDPLWRKLVEFNNRTIETAFLNWRKAFHERNPELVMLISSHVWTGMTDHHLNNRLFRIADSVKMEYSIPIRRGPNRIFSIDKSMLEPEPDARLALGYTLARDAADGRPAHIWTHGLLDETSTLYATAGMVTHGSIANLDIAEATIPNSMFKKAFALGERVSPCFAGTTPLRWAAVHYAESARNALAPDEIRQWKEVLYPLYGAYRALLRARLPVSVVTDSQLEEGLLSGYQVLFLPAPNHLTPRMKAAVQDFAASGGTVVEQRESWQWHAPDGGQQQATEAFMEELSGLVDSAAVRVVGGPEKMHAVCFAHREADRLTIALANDFSWVYTGHAPDAAEVAELTKTPRPCRGVKIVVRRNEKPKRVFDAVGGSILPFETLQASVTIAVPEFEHMAVVVVEF